MDIARSFPIDVLEDIGKFGECEAIDLDNNESILASVAPDPIKTLAEAKSHLDDLEDHMTRNFSVVESTSVTRSKSSLSLQSVITVHL